MIEDYYLVEEEESSDRGTLLIIYTYIHGEKRYNWVILNRGKIVLKGYSWGNKDSAIIYGRNSMLALRCRSG